MHSSMYCIEQLQVFPPGPGRFAQFIRSKSRRSKIPFLIPILPICYAQIYLAQCNNISNLIFYPKCYFFALFYRR